MFISCIVKAMFILFWGFLTLYKWAVMLMFQRNILLSPSRLMGEDADSVCPQPVQSVHVNERKTVFMVQDQHEQWCLKSLWGCNNLLQVSCGRYDATGCCWSSCILIRQFKTCRTKTIHPISYQLFMLVAQNPPVCSENPLSYTKQITSVQSAMGR
jgi:hypothetical protein